VARGGVSVAHHSQQVVAHESLTWVRLSITLDLFGDCVYNGVSTTRLRVNSALYRFGGEGIGIMAKMKMYAVVKMIVIRQVDFEADEDLSKDKLGDLAVELAEEQFGKCEETEIVEMDYRGVAV